LKIKAHIIAREGSKRVIRKNLRDLNGKPMVCYAIEAALESELLTNENIFLNTECPEIAQIGADLGVSLYDRIPSLADDNVVLDELTYDFIENEKCDIVGMINPVCPLTTGKDIDAGIKEFLDKNYDSLITVKEEQLQSFYRNDPINFNKDRKLDKTQNLNPIQIVTWNFCFWKTKIFRENYQTSGNAVFAGNLGLFKIDKIKGIKISNEDDFRMAEMLLRNSNLLNYHS
jgi:CMP-N,N'-diacetyllegionaminic acid synthase